MEIQIIKLDNEKNRKFFVDLALVQYVGEICSICGYEFKAVEDLKNRKVKCSGKNPFTIACGECFKTTQAKTFKQNLKHSKWQQ